MERVEKCPFCGRNAYLIASGPNEGCSYTVACTNKECIAFSGLRWYKTKEETLNRWNARAKSSLAEYVSEDITFCLDADGRMCKRCIRNPKNINHPEFPHSYSHLLGTEYCEVQNGKSSR